MKNGGLQYTVQGRRQGVGRVYFFYTRVSRDHLHITIHLT